LLEYLAGRYEVDVIVFREPGEQDPALGFPAGVAHQIHVLDLPPHTNRVLPRVLRNAGRLVRGVPPLIDRFAGFGDRMAGLVRGENYQVAVIEHFWCAPYWEQVAPRSARTILDLHNIESVLHERCARTEDGPEALAHQAFCQAARDLEAYWLPRYDCLLTASDADALRARAMTRDSRVAVYPNAIRHVPQPKVRERDLVVFSGNLGYHPNVSAVRFFRNAVWPVLRERWASLVWRLVGKNPETVRKYTAGDERIELSGAVENAIEELAAAKVVVIPLLAGSGTRFKVIEAWAAGRAVVSTTIGAEGLPARHNENLLIADGGKDFASAVSRLLDSPHLRAELGVTGRALFESELTWERAWQNLDL
jgi:glycosyltransferase involved in cell wall biosynthesis